MSEGRERERSNVERGRSDSASKKTSGRGAGWRDQVPATHIEKTARRALLGALNRLGDATGRNTTIGQMTRGDDRGNAMLDRLALDVADYMRRHPVPESRDV